MKRFLFFFSEINLKRQDPDITRQDNIIHTAHDVAEHMGVGSIGIVDIDLLVLAAVQAHKP